MKRKMHRATTIGTIVAWTLLAGVPGVYTISIPTIAHAAFLGEKVIDISDGLALYRDGAVSDHYIVMPSSDYEDNQKVELSVDGKFALCNKLIQLQSASVSFGMEGGVLGPSFFLRI